MYLYLKPCLSDLFNSGFSSFIKGLKHNPHVRRMCHPLNAGNLLCRKFIAAGKCSIIQSADNRQHRHLFAQYMLQIALKVIHK